MIQRISIHYKDREGQRAHCGFKRDGSIKGGHFSGTRDSPRFHFDEGVLGEEEKDAMWGAAGELEGSKGIPPQDDWSTYMEMVIESTDGEIVSFTWPVGRDPEDSRVQALADIVKRNKIGGW